jgi:hypothetical protein
MESMVDWKRTLWDNFGMDASTLLMPKTDEISDLTGGFCEGDMMNLYSSRIVGLLAALGFMEKRGQRRELVFCPHVSYDIFLQVLDGTLPVSTSYFCLKDSPFWLRDYLYTQDASDYYDDL